MIAWNCENPGHQDEDSACLMPPEVFGELWVNPIEKK
jgi:hypothetical protein